jgi:endoglucanase
VLGVCTPDCQGKTCGDDGCGQPCGECTGTDSCDATGNCTPCVPDCTGKQCGDDRCDGTCGSPCATGEVCSADRVCVPYDSLGGPPRLHVDGRLLADPTGTPVIVRGISLIDIGMQHVWRGGVPQALDLATREGWNTQVVRLPVYPGGDPWPFPLHDRVARETYLTDILRPAVDYATRKGLYVIVDWHEISSVTSSKDEDARTFWAYMAGQFADYPNVIYELFNEPIDTVPGCVTGETDACWPPFKAQAEGWIDIVRTTAPESLILIGGPSWSQVIGPAADDPIADPNVAYVGHIYPFHVTENDAVEQQIRRCAAVHPVFLTEWGYGFDAADRTADKQPYADIVQTMADELGLHHTAWVADYDWAPPMYSDSQGTLTDFGEFVKTWLAQ